MPIIINEIEVLVEVTPTAAGGQASATAVNTEQIVKECVEKVMEIINQKNER